MSRAIILLSFACLNAGFAYGMDCSYGHSSNFVEEFVNSCPSLLHPDASYCCYDIERHKSYCCKFDEFIVSSSWIIAVMIIAVAIVVSLVVCCISCLCCSCCPWYRRRHQGTVYGKVQVPSVTVIQTPSVPQQMGYNTYPTASAGISQPPPQLTNELYARQAPYNPNYISSVHN